MTEIRNDENIAVKRERSASYPAYTVLGSFKFATTINEKFGVGAELSRQEIAHVLEVHENTLSRPVASCVQYGFLKRNSATGKYQLTKMFSDIFLPESEKEKKILLIKAFGTPKLYKDLIDKFDNNIIPAEFVNTLIKHHYITDTAAPAASETFIEGAKEVGILNESRVLKYGLTLSTLEKTTYAEIVENSTSGNDGFEIKNPPVVFEPVYPTASDDIRVPIHLTKGKRAYLGYPANIDAKDIKLLEHAIQGILLRLNLESDEDDTQK